MIKNTKFYTNIKIIISALLLLNILFIFNINQFALTGTITENVVRMRRNPTTDSEIIMNFDVGDKLQIIEKTNDKWYKVQYKEKVGYIYSDFIKQDVEGQNIQTTNNVVQKKEDTKIEVKIDNKTTVEDKKIDTMNVKKIKINENISAVYLPTYFSNKTINIIKDVEYNYIDEKGEWIKIEDNNFNAGWILKKYVIYIDKRGVCDLYNIRSIYRGYKGYISKYISFYIFFIRYNYYIYLPA